MTQLTPEEIRQRMAEILREQMDRPALLPRPNVDARRSRQTATEPRQNEIADREQIALLNDCA